MCHLGNAARDYLNRLIANLEYALLARDGGLHHRVSILAGICHLRRVIHRRIVGHRPMVLLNRLSVGDLIHLNLLEVVLYVLLIKVLIPTRNTGIPICPFLAAVDAILLVAFPFLYQAPLALPALRLVFAHVHIHVHVHREA